MKKIKLYSLATPNGQKVATFLEAAKIPYEATTIDIMAGDQFSSEFIAINPNSKIPAILDPEGPNGKEHAVFESAAILLYLAKKHGGKFIPKDAVKESEMMQWLFFQMGGAGPMFGQFGHFYRFGAEKCPHPYPLERYGNETKRLLAVIEKRLKGRDWIVDELSLADFALAPWIVCLDKIYNARAFLQLNDYKNIEAWVARFLNVPGVSKGMEVCKINRN